MKKFIFVWLSLLCAAMVFAEHVNIDPKIETSKFSVKEVHQPTAKKVFTVDLEINRQGKKSTVSVYPKKFPNQESYFFVWSDDMPDFMSSDPVGTFKWNPKTNEITHISHIGSFTESAWCIASDDGKYLFQDEGTSPALRAIYVYDLKTEKRLFSGTYWKYTDYDGESVVCADIYDSANAKQNSFSDEVIEKVEEYKKTLSAEDLNSKTIIIRYKLKLDTMTKEFIDCMSVMN